MRKGRSHMRTSSNSSSDIKCHFGPRAIRVWSLESEGFWILDCRFWISKRIESDEQDVFQSKIQNLKSKIALTSDFFNVMLVRPTKDRPVKSIRGRRPEGFRS